MNLPRFSLACVLALGILISLVFSGCYQPQSQHQTITLPQTTARIVLAYFPYGQKTRIDATKIDYKNLTHIAHAFTKSSSAGNLIVDPDYLDPKLISEAHKNNVKVLMSIGGWGNCEGFPGMASSAQTRKTFIDQVLTFCKTNGYDGVDIDWEFVSNAAEQQDFVSLIKELSSALKAQAPPLLLTMAAPSGDYWGHWISYEKLVNDFDYFGWMTYDYHGSWTNHSGHNSPLYSSNNDACGSVHDSYLYALSRKIPEEKLLLGIPFYGRSFDCAQLYQKFQKSNDYAYFEIRNFVNSGWTYLWDEKAMVPYILRPDKGEIISFDNERSISLKCDYISQKRIAGVIVWELTQDDYQSSMSLLSIIGTKLKRPQN